MKTYETYALPILRLSGLEEYHEFMITKHQNHTTEICSELDVSKYRVVATISGDGCFHEMVNGLLGRKDWMEAAKLPIGCISAGSSNAIGQNLDTENPGLAALAIIKGKTAKMDVLSIIQNNTVTYSHLSVFWTLVADVDIESEKFRMIGALRMVLMVIIRLINFRSYHGKLYLLTAEQAEDHVVLNKSSHNGIESILLSSGPKPKYITTARDAFKDWPAQIESSFKYFAGGLGSNYSCQHAMDSF